MNISQGAQNISYKQIVNSSTLPPSLTNNINKQGSGYSDLTLSWKVLNKHFQNLFLFFFKLEAQRGKSHETQHSAGAAGPRVPPAAATARPINVPLGDR